MAKRVYRTAQGKSVDLGALQLQNETVRAVGNMGVNARGDIVNPQNKTVDTRNQTVNRQYKKQVRRSNVSEDPVLETTVEETVKTKTVETPTKQEPVIEKEVVTEPVPQPVNEQPELGGLAGAIAKAKSIKQEPIKTPRQLAQERAGVKKI